jgi:hypothetical protein
MGKKNKAPPAPDYTPIANAQKESAEIAGKTSREMLDWAKEEYAGNKALLERVLDVQLPIMKNEAEEGKKLRERYNEVFQPIEDSLIKESQEYATGARSDYDAGRAMAAVGQSFDAARSNALARMESYGVDPSQTRSQALDAGIRVQEAAAKAAAGTQSRLNTENVGRAMRSEAINIGRGLPGNIASAYGTAMQAGQAGMGNALATTASGSSTMGTGMGWAGQQNGALNGWSNTIGKQYEGALSHYNTKKEASNSMGSSIGSLAGMAAGAFAGPMGSSIGSMIGGTVGKAFAEGGEIPHDPRDPEGKLDTVNAKLSGGEFIIPASAVRRLGSDHFDKLISRYGDEGDRQAALSRIHSGRPGGEPVGRTRRSALAA